MAKVLAEGDIIKTIVYCQLQGQVSQNSFYHRVGPTLAAQYTDQQFASVFFALIQASYLAAININATLRGLTCQVIAPTLFDAVIHSNPQAGTGAGDAMPPGTALSVERRTGVGGRKNRGRFYIPFPSELHNDANGHPTAAYLTLAATLATATIQTVAMTGGANEVGIAPVQWPSDVGVGRLITSMKTATEWTMNNSRSHKSSLNTTPV